MGLESATYISDLNASNPLANDAISEADDHIRLLKSTIKASFPNVNGAVSATDEELSKKTAIISDGAGQLSFNTNVTQALLQTLLGIKQPALSVSGSTLSIDSGTTASAIKTQLSITDSSALDAYPVGSVYLSVLDANPNTLFGTSTWVRIAEGKMLVGQQTSDTDFDVAEETGGAKTVTLTTDQMPAHTHTVSGIENPSGSGSTGSEDGASSFNNSLTTSSTGGGQAHDNMPPYFVVYMWKRTA